MCNTEIRKNKEKLKRKHVLTKNTYTLYCVQFEENKLTFLKNKQTKTHDEKKICFIHKHK